MFRSNPMPSLSPTRTESRLQVPALAAVDGVVALVAAFVVLVPFVRLVGIAGQYDSQRIAELGVLMLAVLLVSTTGGARAFRRGAALVPGPAKIGLLGAVGLGLAASAAAPAPLYALAGVGMVAVLVGLALALAGHWRESAVDARILIEMVAMACAATCAYAVYSAHVTSVLGGGEGWPDVSGAFSNRRHLNQVQLVVLPLTLAWTARLASDASASLARRCGAWGLRLLSALHVAVWIASAGRASALGFVLGCLVVAALYRRQVGPVVRETIIALVLGALAYVLLFEVFGGAGGAFERKHVLSNRDVHWAASLRILADRPWLGIGPMQYAYFSEVSAHPHNLALRLATEWGLPAAGLLLGIMAWAVRGWLGLIRRTAAHSGRSFWRAALTVALVGTLVNAAFDSFMMAPASQAWAILLIAALLTEYGRMCQDVRVEPAPSEPSSAGVLWRVGVPLALGLAFAPLVSVAVHDVPTLPRRSYDRRAWIKPTLNYPRFWQVGTLAPPEGVDTPQKRRYWPAQIEPSEPAAGAALGTAAGTAAAVKPAQ